MALAEDLRSSFPQVFREDSQDEIETTYFFHSDFNVHKVLIHRGKLSAMPDWGCISTLPNWMSHSIPKFLQGQLRWRFDRKDYGKDVESDPDSLLAEHRREYEQRILGSVFKDETEIVAWMERDVGTVISQSPTLSNRLLCAMIGSVARREIGWETNSGKVLKIHDERDHGNWREEQGVACAVVQRVLLVAVDKE